MLVFLLCTFFLSFTGPGSIFLYENGRWTDSVKGDNIASIMGMPMAVIQHYHPNHVWCVVRGHCSQWATERELWEWIHVDVYEYKITRDKKGEVIHRGDKQDWTIIRRSEFLKVDWLRWKPGITENQYDEVNP